MARTKFGNPNSVGGHGLRRRSNTDLAAVVFVCQTPQANLSLAYGVARAVFVSLKMGYNAKGKRQIEIGQKGRPRGQCRWMSPIPMWCWQPEAAGQKDRERVIERMRKSMGDLKITPASWLRHSRPYPYKPRFRRFQVCHWKRMGGLCVSRRRTRFRRTLEVRRTHNSKSCSVNHTNEVQSYVTVYP